MDSFKRIPKLGRIYDRATETTPVKIGGSRLDGTHGGDRLSR